MIFNIMVPLAQLHTFFFQFFGKLQLIFYKLQSFFLQNAFFLLNSDILASLKKVRLESGKKYYVGSRGNNVEDGEAIMLTMKENLIQNADVDPVPAQTYTGTVIRPKPTVRYGKETLTEGKDYRFFYEDNKNLGTATMIITGEGDYVETKEITFNIIQLTSPVVPPVTPEVTEKSLEKIAFKVSFTPIGYNDKFRVTTNTVKGAVKWQVQYSTKKNFADAKTKTYTSAGRLYRQYVKAGDKTTYYIRIRAIRGNYKSGWSDAKKVTTK